MESYPNLPTAQRALCNLRFSVDDASNCCAIAEVSPMATEMEALVLVNRSSLDENAGSGAGRRHARPPERIMEPDFRHDRGRAGGFPRSGKAADDRTIVFVAGHGISIS